MADIEAIQKIIIDKLKELFQWDVELSSTPRGRPLFKIDVPILKGYIILVLRCDNQVVFEGYIEL